MYFIKTPGILKTIFPSNLIWDIHTEDKIIYLTIDDGPTPDLTPAILNILKEFNAQATFFCVGENIKKHPFLYSEILNAGHTAGNHTFNHLNGWKTATADYINNVGQCKQLVAGDLFRPPYGRISFSQNQALRKDFRIVMWSVLSGDFDQKVSKEKCLGNVIKHAKQGSIVVFHDHIKAARNLLYALPGFLEEFEKKGYRFEGLG